MCYTVGFETVHPLSLGIYVSGGRIFVTSILLEFKIGCRLMLHGKHRIQGPASRGCWLSCTLQLSEFCTLMDSGSETSSVAGLDNIVERSHCSDQCVSEMDV